MELVKYVNNCARVNNSSAFIPSMEFFVDSKFHESSVSKTSIFSETNFSLAFTNNDDLLFYRVSLSGNIL